MKKSEVSIIVPIYNNEKYVEKCIYSILNQSYSDFELILVNDGSTDGTLDILKGFKDKRIKLINKNNEGVSKARNDGLNYATGEYIIFVDSDDYIDRSLLEKLILKIKLNKTDIVACNIDFHNTVYNDVDLARFSNEYKDYEYLYNHSFFNTPYAKLYKRKLIKSYFDSKFNLGEDLIFNVDYLLNCDSFSLVPEKLYYYNTDNEGSLTKKFYPNIISIQIHLYNKMKKLLREKKIESDWYDKKFCQIIIGYILVYCSNIEFMNSYYKNEYYKVKNLIYEFNWNVFKVILINKLAIKIMVEIYKIKKLTE